MKLREYRERPGALLLLALACLSSWFLPPAISAFKRDSVQAMERLRVVVILEVGSPLPRDIAIERQHYSGMCYRGVYAAETPADLRRLLRQFPMDSALAGCLIDYQTLSDNARRSFRLGALLRELPVTRSPQGRLVYATVNRSVLGVSGVSELVLEALLLAILASIYGVVRNWSHDLSAAYQFIRRAPALVLIPIVGAAAGAVIGSNLRAQSVEVASNAVSVALTAPLIEEILYRGLLFLLVSRYSPQWFASTFLATLFAYSHGHTASESLEFFLFALGAHYLFIRSQSVSLCFVPHVLLNTVVVAKGLSPLA